MLTGRVDFRLSLYKTMNMVAFNTNYVTEEKGPERSQQTLAIFTVHLLTAWIQNDLFGGQLLISDIVYSEEVKGLPGKRAKNPLI